MQNLLVVGAADKNNFIRAQLGFSEPTLVIDDGPLIDALELPQERADFSVSREIVTLDWTRHHFNPLQQVDYLKACELLSVFQAAFPAGQNTLTKEGAWDFLLETFLSGDRGARLDRLFKAKLDDPGYISAQRMVRRLLRSPVLKQVLCASTNFPLDGVLLARIDRAKLGDFDSFLLANCLIGQFKGQVVVLDGGFYLRDHHTTLIRQNRIVLSANFLDELSPKLREAALTIARKVAYRTTPRDADTLHVFFPHVLHPEQLTNQEGEQHQVSWHS